MSVQVRRRRESAAFLSTFVGAQGELLVDTTNNRVQVHDGVTPGGFPAATVGEVVTNARTAVIDADYTVMRSDRTVALTALSVSRTMTLPPASTYPTGTRLLVVDESGACSATTRIVLAAAGVDRVNGAPAAIIATAYGFVALGSDGATRWTVLDQSTGSAVPLLGAPVGNFLFTPGGDGQVSFYRSDVSRTPNPRASTLAGVAGASVTLSGANDAALFFNAVMAGVSFARMWNTTRGTAAWIVAAPAGNQLTVTAAADVAGWRAGDAVQIGDPAAQHGGQAVIALDVSPMLKTVFGTVFPQTGVLAKASTSGVNANLAISGSAAQGSFVSVSCPNDGSASSGMVLAPCTVASPISRSNLVFVREQVGGSNPLGVTLMSSLAVFA